MPICIVSCRAVIALAARRFQTKRSAPNGCLCILKSKHACSACIHCAKHAALHPCTARRRPGLTMVRNLHHSRQTRRSVRWIEHLPRAASRIIQLSRGMMILQSSADQVNFSTPCKAKIIQR